MSRSRARRVPSLSFGLWLIGGVLVAHSPANANGRFPAANQLVVDPDDATHLVVRATYGTMISHDGGRTMRLVCEQAIGATGDADPMLGLFAGGTMVAGVVSGLAATRDEGCSWSLLPGFLPREYVVDVTVQKDDPRRGLVVSSTAGDGGGFHTVLFETNDGAATFHTLGHALGTDFLAQTVEVAPSDPRRIYVSGTVTADGGAQTPAVLRSIDRGASFTRTMLSSFGAGHSAWISAVDPKAPGTVYVRMRTTDKDRLLVSTDGAKTFRETYAAVGSLTGFALSPDGTEVALGGAGDGILVASTRDFVWKKASPVHAQCLTWTKAGLYACGVEWLDHFVVGLSVDRGATFTALSHMSDPCPVRCAAESTVARTCTDELWRGTQASIQQPPETCGGGHDAGVAAAPSAPTDEGDEGRGQRNLRLLAMGAISFVLVLVLAGGAAFLRSRRRRTLTQPGFRSAAGGPPADRSEFGRRFGDFARRDSSAISSTKAPEDALEDARNADGTTR